MTVTLRWIRHVRNGARRTKIALAAPAIVASLVLTGACTNDAGTLRTLTVVGTEMTFDAPERVAAGDYSTTFRNDGAVAHELAFRDPAGTFVARRSIGAGASVTFDVSLQPGTWELGCFEPGHYEAGMHRPLIVEPANRTSAPTPTDMSTTPGG